MSERVKAHVNNLISQYFSWFANCDIDPIHPAIRLKANVEAGGKEEAGVPVVDDHDVEDDLRHPERIREGCSRFRPFEEGKHPINTKNSIHPQHHRTGNLGNFYQENHEQLHKCHNIKHIPPSFYQNQKMTKTKEALSIVRYRAKNVPSMYPFRTKRWPVVRYRAPSEPKMGTSLSSVQGQRLTCS